MRQYRNDILSFLFRAKWHHEAGTKMSNTQNIRQTDFPIFISIRMQLQKYQIDEAGI